jgi:hypothetical protein
MGWRYVPPERGRTGDEAVATLVGRQSADATTGTGVAAESCMRARKVKARPRTKARNEGILTDVSFELVWKLSAIDYEFDLICIDEDSIEEL